MSVCEGCKYYSQCGDSQRTAPCSGRVDAIDIEDSMYGILTMSGNYEERMVANTKEDDWEVDTVEVTDRSWLYETAVRHPKFRQGSWIVVEGASNIGNAEAMHNRWVEIMRNNPKIIRDCYEDEYFMYI